MRNTRHKLFHDKTLKRLHNELNICGVVRNHFLALSMRYYRRYGKGLLYSRMSKHLTKLKQLAKYKQYPVLVGITKYPKTSLTEFSRNADPQARSPAIQVV